LNGEMQLNTFKYSTKKCAESDKFDICISYYKYVCLSAWFYIINKLNNT